MAHVVTAPCIGCKYTDCVSVCPCDSFREGETMLYIEPSDCIDCRACAPECPTNAIFQDDEVPPAWHPYIALNAEQAGLHPVIREKRAP